ncbi:MAG: polymerase protein [Candidatus Uhrbacteria bacterium GW2011_GWD2_52_7]|uniref:DNA polymerase I n=1 Tax=Candidatus Uhrbacteria bacterium GW2011_GWD2_52_7 TaxID=1618989 RepID=A0A0G2ADW4_9BACT|nr:MAG: polymerase protein [Candidatus Uhrbacteria bacterium GW2011_GWD2_52_7]
MPRFAIQALIVIMRPTMTAHTPTFLVLDGNALLHRAWHAIPPLTTKDGRVVNAVYGFAMVVEKMLAEFKPDFMAVAWDLPGGTFRHEEYAQYKATREKKAQELYDQIPIIQDLLSVYGIPSLSVPGFEGDDILGTIAKLNKASGYQTLIVTGDLDSLQLVDETTNVIFFVKGLSQTKRYDAAAVYERYGLRPDQLIDLKTLLGDTSDNLPGISGIGEKTALELLREHGSVDGIFQDLKAGKVLPKYAKKLEGQEEVAAQMRRLVTIVCDVDLHGFDVSSAKVLSPDLARLIPMLQNLEFKTLLKKYDRAAPATPVSAPRKAPKVIALPAAKLDDLDRDVLGIVLDTKATDLFGGCLESLVLTDGHRTVAFDQPDSTVARHAVAVLASAKEIVGHDLKAVLHALHRSGVDVSSLNDRPMFDTMVAAYLLAPGGREFGFGDIVREELGATISADALPLERLGAVLPLMVRLKARLAAEGMTKLSQEIEMPLIPVLFAMERDGIAVDVAKLKTLSVAFDERLQTLTKEIYQVSGREFNINAPAQLADVLFVSLGIPTKGIKKTKSGFSTAAPELDKITELHPIVRLISEYRELAKLKSTYADSLPMLVGPDSRIHAKFNQCVAATGRLSSSDPNLQNIPIRSELGREIRKAFVAAKDHVLLSADYSQIELRLAAHIAKDKALIDAFLDGADIHRRTAAQMWDISEDEVTKDQRFAAKAINFGILYGIGPRSLSRSANVSFEEAREFVDRYFQAHPGIRSFIDEMKVRAHADGYVETLFGRRRYLSDINSGVPQLVAAAERMAINMPAQGTQADIIKLAMTRVDAWIRSSGLRIRMLLQVHDELVFEVHEDDKKQAAEEISSIMESVAVFDVPLLVDVDSAKTWGDME